MTITSSERVSMDRSLQTKVKSTHVHPPPASYHVTNDLPCPEDKDLSPIPHPAYLPADIPLIQSMLTNFLPTELADIIIDMAEFWPYVGVSRNSYTSAISALEGQDSNAEWCYLVSPPVPALERDGVRLPTTVRKVKFFIKSYDSCYGGKKEDQGVFQGFKTWFEASILKSSDPEALSYENDTQPHDWFTSLSGPHPKLLNNLLVTEVAGAPNPFDQKPKWNVTDGSVSTKGWHEIVWSPESVLVHVPVSASPQAGNRAGFVDTLSVDDRIVLMARALSPGWISTVFNVKMEIYYSLPFSEL